MATVEYGSVMEARARDMAPMAGQSLRSQDRMLEKDRGALEAFATDVCALVERINRAAGQLANVNDRVFGNQPQSGEVDAPRDKAVPSGELAAIDIHMQAARAATSWLENEVLRTTRL